MSACQVSIPQVFLYLSHSLAPQFLYLPVHLCKTNAFTFPLFNTYNLNQDAVGTDITYNSQLSGLSFAPQSLSFFSFSFSVYLGLTSYLSQTPHLHRESSG